MAMAQAQTTLARRNGRARETLKESASEVLSDLDTLRKDMARLADAANQAARAEVAHTGERIGRLSQQVRERAGAGADYVSEQVRTHPTATVGIALGAGLLLGWLISRR
jgi:ElaB/YqjD/DUF883 family membrane-anchored ribosome-binding protein